MNLPNLLTLLRIFFVPLLVAALVQENLRYVWRGLVLTNEILALGIFLAAAATDLLDGYLARRWGQVTTVGTLLDPIADKLLISAALIALVQVRVISAWVAILLIGRDFAVSGLRAIAASEGYTIRASELGKTKMIMQVAAISLLLMGLHWKELMPLALLTLWLAVAFSLVSAVDYTRKFWRGIDQKVKLRRRRELLRLERRRKREAALLARSGRTTAD